MKPKKRTEKSPKRLETEVKPINHPSSGSSEKHRLKSVVLKKWEYVSFFRRVPQKKKFRHEFVEKRQNSICVGSCKKLMSLDTSKCDRRSEICVQQV